MAEPSEPLREGSPSGKKRTRVPKVHKVDSNSSPENVIKFTYDIYNDKWTQTPGTVVLESKPFDEGTMRAAFCMIDPSKPPGQQKYVAKMSKNPKDDLTIYFMDVEMQALSKLFAEEYNKRNPPKLVDFNEASVIRCLERRGQPLLAVEPWLDGHFSKYSNNYGFISYHDRNTPQAFSHFTYCHSAGKLLICDIQGVCDKYTDPQIHSRDGKGFGKGNLGYEGMLKFFSTHRCSSICRYLNLPQHNPKAEENESELEKKVAQSAQIRADEPPGKSLQDEKANPLDLKFLNLEQAQLDYIKKNFAQVAVGSRVDQKGLVALCRELGTEIAPDEAGRLVTKFEREKGSLDIRQFLWWWCGIEES